MLLDAQFWTDMSKGWKTILAKNSDHDEVFIGWNANQAITILSECWRSLIMETKWWKKSCILIKYTFDLIFEFNWILLQQEVVL